MTPVPTATLDSGRLSGRRLELGLSVRGLAAAADISESVIRRLEDPARTNDVPGDRLVRLAEALGCSPSWLVGGDAVTDDVRVLGATLWRVAGEQLVPAAALARGLGWVAARVEAAAEGLNDRLADSGLQVHCSVRGLGIRPAAGAAHEEAAAAVTRAASASSSTPVNHATILHQVARGEPLPNTLSNADEVAIRTLVNAGRLRMVTGSGSTGRVALTEEVAYSLDVDGASWAGPRTLTVRRPPARLPWLETE